MKIEKILKRGVLVFVLLLGITTIRAQAVVSDPIVKTEEDSEWGDRLAQWVEELTGITETVNTATDIFDQSKEWYDALKAVKKTIENYKKIKEIVNMILDIKNIVVTNLKKIQSDTNFTPEEIVAIAAGYEGIINEGIKMADELSMGTSATDLSLTDKDRYDIINTIYKKVKDYKALVQYYTRKNISVSYLRAKKKNERDRVLQLYGQ